MDQTTYDQSTIWGFIHIMWINPLSLDTMYWSFSNCGYFYNWQFPRCTHALFQVCAWESIQNPWINPQYSDLYTIRWSTYKLWINPLGVDQTKICGSIHNMWIIPQSIDQSTLFIQNMWINLQFVDQSTILGSIHNLWFISSYG